MADNQEYINRLQRELAQKSQELSQALSKKAECQAKINKAESILRQYETMKSQIDSAVGTLNDANGNLGSIISLIGQNMEGTFSQSISGKLGECESSNGSAISRLEQIKGEAEPKISEQKRKKTESEEEKRRVEDRIPGIETRIEVLRASIRAAYNAMEY